MSYDVYVGGSDADLNYTRNGNSLFYNHIPDNGKGGGLRELHNTPNKEVVVIMSNFFESVNRERHSFFRNPMVETVGEPEMCAKYDPPNGWGSLVAALIFAAQIMGEAAKHPDGVTEVSM